MKEFEMRPKWFLNKIEFCHGSLDNYAINEIVTNTYYAQFQGRK